MASLSGASILDWGISWSFFLQKKCKPYDYSMERGLSFSRYLPLVDFYEYIAAIEEDIHLPQQVFY